MLHEGGETVPAGPNPLVLEPIQNQLYGALKTKSESLARMYISALRVFAQGDNEDRIHLAAHSIREMIGKLPSVIDVPIEDGAKQSLSNFVNGVNDGWRKLCNGKRWPGTPRWQGSIDKGLERFLTKIEDMLQAETRIKKDRKAILQRVIRKQNFSVVPLPNDIEDLRTAEWMRYHEFFTKIAHFNPTE